MRGDTSERVYYSKIGEAFSIGPMCYLMKFLAFGLVDVTVLLLGLKNNVSVSHKMSRHNISRNCCFKGLVIIKINWIDFKYALFQSLSSTAVSVSKSGSGDTVFCFVLFFPKILLRKSQGLKAWVSGKVGSFSDAQMHMES